MTPALPETDPIVMAAALEEFFPRECPGLGLCVQRCRLMRAYEKPGKTCLLAYQM